jgi:oligopeptide transport system substrate-binding protein
MKKLVCLLLCAALALGMAGAVAEDKVTYTTLYSSEVTTLNYLVTSSTNEFGIAANLIDTLVEYDMYGRMLPSLASAWENSEDGLTWTFTLRQDACWVDGNNEVVAPVTANDFVAAAKYILDASHASSTADILYGLIAGAEAYYNGTAAPEEGKEPAPVMEWDTVGVKALDKNTLEYTLIAPTPYFLSSTTYVCFMPVCEAFLNEMGDNFGLATGNDTLLYNGAYVLSEFKPQERTVLSKNAANWDADKVYIDKIDQIYNKEAASVAPKYFLDGTIDGFAVDNALAADWLADPVKSEYLHPVRQYGQYSYWYAFDYNPAFEEEYEIENWKIAVANENFRQSIFHGLDRVKTMTHTDPDNAEELIYNTITPPNFTVYQGVDYTTLGALKEISALGADTFDEALALEYKEKAVAELTAAGASFPIKMKMMFNPNVSGWADECQTVEQQLEGLLGADYIDIIIVVGPSTGFLANRRQGNFAFMKVNWGADYADPETYTDPFDVIGGNSYRFTDEFTGVDLTEYKELLTAAKAITDDMGARYEAFAKAEAYLIEHGFVMPFGHGSGGYTASLLDPFSGPLAPFGISTDRYKGQYKLETYMDTDAYYDAYDAYEAARDAAE